MHTCLCFFTVRLNFFSRRPPTPQNFSLFPKYPIRTKNLDRILVTMASNKSTTSTSTENIMADLVAVSNELHSELQNLEEESEFLNTLTRENEDELLPQTHPGKSTRRVYSTQALTQEPMDPPSHSRRMNVGIDDLMKSVVEMDLPDESQSKKRSFSTVSSSMKSNEYSVSNLHNSAKRSTAGSSTYPDQPDSVRSAKCA